MPKGKSRDLRKRIMAEVAERDAARAAAKREAAALKAEQQRLKKESKCCYYKHNGNLPMHFKRCIDCTVEFL